MAKRNVKKLIIAAAVLLLAAVLVCGFILLRKRNKMRAVALIGDFGERVNFTVTAAEKTNTVKGYYVLSENNTFLSIRDVAGVLSGSEKHFNVQRGTDGIQWEIRTGCDYVNTTKKENTPFAAVYPGSWSGSNDDQGRDGLLLYSPKVSIDGKAQEYMWYYKAGPDGSPVTDDAFVSLMDLGLMLDLDVVYTSGTDLSISMDKGFALDEERLDPSAYFHDLDGMILGNITADTILCEWNSSEQTEIASTSKLMTWLLLQEAVVGGRLSMQDTVKISENVMKLTNSAYGKDICQASWYVGKEVTLQDLAAAMLLPSSNESALAIAEAVAHAYGNTEDLEKHFVRMMNDRAYELGLRSAMFYNASGLPQYEADQIMAKRGNKMSAGDLYRLAAYIMTYFREPFTAVSAQRAVKLPSFGDSVWAVSSYYDYFSSYEVTGMKTGTTDRAGNCFVASMDVKVNGEVQTVIAVILGAVTKKMRNEQMSVLLEYARRNCR